MSFSLPTQVSNPSHHPVLTEDLGWMVKFSSENLPGSLMDRNIQPVDDCKTLFIPQAHLYVSEASIPFKTSVQYDGTNILLSDSAHNIVRIFSKSDKRMKNLRHDYVGTILQQESDIPLQTISTVNEKSDSLTPDFIDSNLGIVIELATCKSNSEAALSKSYKIKMHKYRGHVGKHVSNQTKPYALYCVCVSTDMVMTNAELSQEIVDELCFRYRVGLELEAKITKLLGVNIFEEIDSTFNMKIVEAGFKSIKFVFDEEGETEKGVKYLFTKDFYRKIKDPCPDNNIIQKLFNKASSDARAIKKDSPEALHQYLGNYTAQNTQLGNKKRVINFPLVYSKRCSDFQSENIIFQDTRTEDNMTLPPWLHKIWIGSVEASVNDTVVDRLQSEFMATSDDPEPHIASIKDLNKQACVFQPQMTFEEIAILAEKGIMGKSNRFLPNVQTKRAMGKLSVHPHENTEDIEMFVSEKTILEDLETDIRVENNILLQLLTGAKSIYNEKAPDGSMLSVDLFSGYLYRLKMIQYMDFISNVCQELSFCYKYNLKEGKFITKRLRQFDVLMVIRPTGSKGHVFVSFCIPKTQSELFDTDRLGPKVYETKNYWVTDFSSFNEVTLEHFVKAGPYMVALFSHLMEHFRIPISDWDTIFGETRTKESENLWKTVKTMMLVYLSNKIGCEELITNQRYLFMTSLNEITSNPYRFVNRFPSVLRSRIESYFIKQYERCMGHLYHNKILKHIESKTSTSELQYLNIPSLFHEGYITLDQKINEFYFGYVVSKQKGRSTDRSFPITKKLVKFEYEYRKKQAKANLALYDGLENYTGHTYSYSLNAFFIMHFKSMLEEKYGEEHQSQLEREIINSFSRDDFKTLATLKASARDMSSVETMYDILLEGTQNPTLTKEVRQRNSRLFSKRPKVIESLSMLCEAYEQDTKAPLLHVFDLVPYCLKALQSKGHFTVDLFAKSQHGGDREIYVLEIMARIVQYFLEKIARTICLKFPSETITHPKNKHSLIVSHYLKTAEQFKSSCSLNKSGDASKWSQYHMVTKFCQMMIGLVSDLFHAFIFNTLRLWFYKKICIPSELFLSFLKNRDVQQSDDYWIKLRDDFFNGKELCEEKCNPLMNIHSGMMQGIWHIVSTLYHTMFQEVYRRIILIHAKEVMGIELVVTILQGSDDSAILIGLDASALKTYVKLIHYYHRFKDELSKYVSIMPSYDKTAECTLDLVEYNSEWFFRTKIVRPTIRWVSACLETSLVENFSSRFQIFSNSLTECLQGGSSTYGNSIIQMSQAWLHYKLIGLDTHVLARDFFQRLIILKDPSIGFMPLDMDFCSGFLGHDFNLYALAKLSSYGQLIHKFQSISGRSCQHPGYSERSTLMSNLRGTTIGFGKIDLWLKILKQLGMESYEEALAKVEADPQLIFSRNDTWKDDKVAVLLKMYTPGVIASLSQYQPVIRMMIASVYMLSRPSFVDWVLKQSQDKPKKSSLYMCAIRRGQIQTPSTDLDLQSIFPLHSQYDSMIKDAEVFHNSASVLKVELTRKSKVEVNIFEDLNTDIYDIMDVVKRKWWGDSSIRTSESHFKLIWEAFSLKYAFLRDTFKETEEAMDMNVLELKHYLEAIPGKARKVVLTDSSARFGRSFHDVVTRVYWPSTKLRTNFELTHHQAHMAIKNIRSKIFSVLSFPFQDKYAEKLCEKILSNDVLGEFPGPDADKKLNNMRIFKSYLSGSSKEELIAMIRRCKQGSLGYFNKVQKFREGRGWYGYGEWIGEIIGTPVKMSFFDEQVTAIAINSSGDIQVVCNEVMGIIKEFRLTIADNLTAPNNVLNEPDVSLSLSKEGRVNHLNHGIPIIKDGTLGLDFIDTLLSSQWRLAASQSRIRLQVKSSRSLASKSFFTILSDEYNIFDYEPTIVDEAQQQEYSLVLNHWSQYKSCPTSILLTWLQPYFQQSRIPMQMHLDQLRLSFVDDCIDFKKLNAWFVSYSASLLSPQVSPQTADTTRTFDNDGMEEDFNPQLTNIKDMVRLMTIEDIRESAVIVDKQGDDPLNLFSLNTMDDVLTSTMMEQIMLELLDDPEYVTQGWAEMRLAKIKMPIAHPFWLHVVSDILTMYPSKGSMALQLFQGRVSSIALCFEGWLGNLFSILSGHDCTCISTMPLSLDLLQKARVLSSMVSDGASDMSSRSDFEGLSLLQLKEKHHEALKSMSSLSMSYSQLSNQQLQTLSRREVGKLQIEIDILDDLIKERQYWGDTNHSIDKGIIELSHGRFEIVAIASSISDILTLAWAHSCINDSRLDQLDMKTFKHFLLQMFFSDILLNYSSYKSRFSVADIKETLLMSSEDTNPFTPFQIAALMESSVFNSKFPWVHLPDIGEEVTTYGFCEYYDKIVFFHVLDA